MIAEFRNCWHVENATSGPIDCLGGFLPTSPGHIVRRGEQVILHYGPDRWLCLDCDPRQIDELHAAAEGSGIEITDVSGYWSKIEFADRESFTDLSAAQPVELLLKDRSCAVMSLFDCPAIAVDGDGLKMLLLRSSYAESFVEAFEKARTAGAVR